MADYLSVLESLGGGSEGGVKAINGAKNGEDSTADSKGTLHDFFTLVSLPRNSVVIKLLPPSVHLTLIKCIIYPII